MVSVVEPVVRILGCSYQLPGLSFFFQGFQYGVVPVTISHQYKFLPEPEHGEQRILCGMFSRVSQINFVCFNVAFRYLV